MLVYDPEEFFFSTLLLAPGIRSLSECLTRLAPYMAG